MKVLSLSFIIISLVIQAAFCQPFDIQGHRGCRGLMPENSIPGFLKAIDMGVTTLEMDVVISADGKVVVSHDPFVSSKFCINEIGVKINKKEEMEINLFMLDYEDIELFDCGSIGNSDFPDQMKISSYKPLLSEVLQKCESYIRSNNKNSVRYNIELKSRPSWDNFYHPEPNIFTQLVYNVIKDDVDINQVCIQSFDMRILQFWRLKYPKYNLSYLVSNSKSASKNIEELGFTPEIYSPAYRLVNKRLIAELHSKNIMVIPWTVNDIKEMKKLIDMGVDGFITDYPDRYFNNFTLKQ